MVWQSTFFEIPLIISAFIALYTASILRNYRHINLYRTVYYLLLAVFFWSVVYLFELQLESISIQLVLAKTEYIAICALPVLWVYFSLQFSYPENNFKWKKVGLFGIPFLATLLIVFTNGLHHWFWKNSTQIVYFNASILTNKYGFWFWIHTILSYAYIIIGSVLVIIRLIREKRRTLSAIIIGLSVLLPIFGSLLFVFKVKTPFDFTPLVLTLSGVLIAVSLARFNLLNIKPIAKSMLFSSFKNPVIFINNEHIIIEANLAAQNLLEIPNSAFYHEKIDTILFRRTGYIPPIEAGYPFEINLFSMNKQKIFLVETDVIRDQSKQEGYLLTLNNVTSDKQINLARTDEIFYTAFLKNMSEISVYSEDLNHLLNGTMQIISEFLFADKVFIVSEDQVNKKIALVLNQNEVSLEQLKVQDISQVLEEVKKERKAQVYIGPHSIRNKCSIDPNVIGMIAYPIYTGQDYFATMFVLFTSWSITNDKRILFTERALIQTSLSVSRLLILKNLEKKVEERTKEMVKLNLDLKNNYNFLDRLVETSPNLVFCLNMSDEVVFCNNKFVREFGFSNKEQVLNKPLDVILEGGKQEFITQILDINHNGEISGQYELSTIFRGEQKQFFLNKTNYMISEKVPAENIYIALDLTKQKDQELRIRNSEQRLLTLFESMPVILFEEDQSEVKKKVDQLLDTKGEMAVPYLQQHPELAIEWVKTIKITDCNQMALDFYGFDSKQELFTEYPLLIANSAKETLVQQITGYLLGKMDFETETVHKRASGEIAYVQMKLYVPPENRSDFRRVLVSVVDITTRRKAEKELANSEEKFRNIIQQSFDGIVLFDQQGNIVEWNEADRRITGYSETDIHDLKIQEIVDLLTREFPHPQFQNIKLPLKNQVTEVDITTKNGKKVTVSASVSSISIGQNQMGSIFLSDISLQKRAQAEIQRLAMAAHEISEGLVIANAQGETEYVNRAVERITGFSRKELLGKNLLYSLNTEFKLDQIDEIQKALQSRIVQRGKAISHKKDGSSYTLQYNIAPIMDNQGNLNFVSVLSDISQSELMEQQNRQTQKLEAIGSLAAGVAHEINTPTQYVGNNLLFIKDEFSSVFQFLDHNRQQWIKAISGEPVDGLVKEINDEEKSLEIDYLSTEIPKAINESLEGIGRVTEIVQAIKEFSHPSMDEMTPVDLNRAIETTITVSKNEWKYVADLKTDLDPGLPSVVCSPGEINQVILNLITNAAQAIKEQIDNGFYKKGLIEILTSTHGKNVEILVKDNGGGIPPQYQEKVFNPFFTTKPVGKGTGQGLSIAYKVIVDKHKGNLTYTTKIGKGTTFKIMLPIGAVKKGME